MKEGSYRPETSDISDEEIVQAAESIEGILPSSKVSFPVNKRKADMESENFKRFKAPREDSKMDQMAKKR